MKKKKQVQHRGPVPVALDVFAKAAMTQYGTAVIEDRALPDYRDGLKPVQRRALWSAHRIGLRANSAPKKAARLVGDVLGKYHPHGDMACYSALVNMVNSPAPTFFGKGNWGTINDSAAASRYTNCKLSKYGDINFFSTDYLSTLVKVPNFDGTEVEPLILPSLLPNLLLNGAVGIAVGTTCGIPPYKLDGVVKIVRMALKGQEVTAKDCYKTLEFNYKYGGSAYVPDKSSRLDLMRFYKTGSGTVKIMPDHKLNPAKKSIQIFGSSPGVNIGKALDRAREDKRVKSAMEITDKTTGGISVFEVILASSVRHEEFQDTANEVVKKYFIGRPMVLKCNITIRKYEKETEKTSAKFKSINMPGLIKAWTSWRVRLELKSLQNRILTLQTEIRNTEVLIAAAENLKIVFRALKSKETEEVLMKGLKITKEEAVFLLSRQIRTLKALEVKELKKKIKTLNASRSELKTFQKNPEEKILRDLDSMVKTITK